MTRLSILYCSVFASIMLSIGAANAQNQAQNTEKNQTTQQNVSSANAIEPRIERIRIEDQSNQINELRVNGQTQSIHVQPKNEDFPAYEVLSNDGAKTRPAGRDGYGGSTGTRVWTLFNF